MSRIGNKAINITSGIEVQVTNNIVKVKGTKGELSFEYSNIIEVKIKEQQVIVTRSNDDRKSKSLHGLTRNLINNMIIGVSQGWQKELEIIGTGYRTEIQGNKINITLGYSHPINFLVPDGIKAEFKEGIITLSGIDKQLVGQVAANIRALRKPDSYKGKGVRYKGEHIILKEGKSGAK